MTKERTDDEQTNSSLAAKSRRIISTMPAKGLPDHFHAEYTFTGSSKQTGNSQRTRRGVATLPFPCELKQKRQKASESNNGKANDHSESTNKRRRVSPSESNTYCPKLYPHVTDHLQPTKSSSSSSVDILICGLNPGLRSSQKGLHFAHPSNHFYRTLHLGGLTPCIVKPESCAELVDQIWPYPSLGLTNICCRPTREGSQLSREDFKSGTPILNAKIATIARPRITVFTGKGIASEWVKCARDVGAIMDHNKSDNKSKSDSKRKIKSGTPCKDESDTTNTITLPFPDSIPFTTTNKQGLGVMPYVFDLNNDESVDSNHRYSFLFLVTSPSGRVTTMHLPEKGRWMGIARDTWQFLIGKKELESDCKMVQREFEIVRMTEVKSEDDGVKLEDDGVDQVDCK